MDLLSEILQSIDVEATSFVNFHLPAPWGLDIGDADKFSPAYCYCLIEGEAVNLQPGQPPARLAPGDVLLFPGGGASRIASSPHAAVSRIGDIWQGRHLPDFNAGETLAFPTHLHFDGDGPGAHLLALAFRFRGRRHDRLLGALPHSLLLRTGQRAAIPFLRTALDFLSEDDTGQSPGHIAIANELAKLLFIFLLRESLLQDQRHANGWLRAVLDRQLGKAMRAIHQRPAAPWTVASLASEAGMSRSSFAERFHLCTGQSPFDYLTEWRMTCAEEALTHGDQSIEAIMNAVGYQSESAFRKAFSKKTGMTPGSYRKDKRAR